MTADPRRALLAGIALAVAGCAAPGAGPAEPLCTAPEQITLTVAGDALAATLASTTSAADLATRLPVAVDLADPMGQAKSGDWPGEPLAVVEHDLVIDPVEGGIYYAPDSHTIAVYYADLDQRVPPPGWALLATLTPAGVDVVARAGNHVHVTIEECPTASLALS